MTLFKTSVLNGIAVAIRILTLLGLNKVLAVYVGPAGYAVIGQFQNAMQMITAVGSSAISNGVTKYTAEYHDDPMRQERLWRTAAAICLLGSLSTSLVIVVTRKQLAYWLLNDVRFASVFVWLALTLSLFVFNALLLAILNGKKEIGLYVTANIAGSLIALALTVLLTVNHGLYGALVALAVYQSVAFVITASLVYRTGWFRQVRLFGPIDKGVAVRLSRYALMTIVSAACAPLSQIAVRNYLGVELGWDAAGYWEAMWRLSAAYLMLVTTTLSVYYLPRLSELREPEMIMREIRDGYRLIVPFVAVSGFVLYWMRDVVIDLLFTPDFRPMRDLFAWQMVGDTLKVGSWLLGYLMLGKAMFGLFIGTEVVFTLSFVALAIGLTAVFGLTGVAIAHALNYLAYWSYLAVAIRGRLAANEEPQSAR